MLLQEYAPSAWDKFRDSLPIITFNRDGCTVDVLAVEDGFQTARYTYLPSARVEDHCHPESESVQFHVAGSLNVWFGRRVFTVNDETTKGRMLYIPKGRSHGAEAGPQGATFIAVEQHDGIPTPVIGCPHGVWEVTHDTVLSR